MALFKEPRHPYTCGLVEAVRALGEERDAPLRGIPGSVPDFRELPAGCTFHPRCPIGDEGCIADFPPLLEVEPGRFCACYKA
jgi:peptide/nickel transport system ATP-binding protein